MDTIVKFQFSFQYPFKDMRVALGSKIFEAVSKRHRHLVGSLIPRDPQTSSCDPPLHTSGLENVKAQFREMRSVRGGKLGFQTDLVVTLGIAPGKYDIIESFSRPFPFSAPL